MSDERRIKPLPRRVKEENVAPPRQEKLLPPGTRPIIAPAVNSGDRESRDDLEHIAAVDRLERERAQLLAKLQDSEAENKSLRDAAPTFTFPPATIPPAKERSPQANAAPAPQVAPASTFPISHQLRSLATAVGIFVAIAFSAFNSYRVSPEKVEAVQARVTQNEQSKSDEIKQRVLQDQRDLARWRATHCYIQQLRGAVARQGLDLSSLPPGGVTVLRLQDDPKKPPVFVAKEKCPDFPPLPPEMGYP